MDKSETLNLKINPTLKTDAETVLSRIGIPMSTAVDMFLSQVILVGGIPFPVAAPNPPADIDMTQMTEEQFHAKLQQGYDNYKEGKTRKAEDVFATVLDSDI